MGLEGHNPDICVALNLQCWSGWESLQKHPPKPRLYMQCHQLNPTLKGTSRIHERGVEGKQRPLL